MTKPQLSPLAKKILWGTPQEAGELCKDVAKEKNTDKELALACRYRGLDYVKALVENGASFRHGGIKGKPIKYRLALLTGNEWLGSAAGMEFKVRMNDIIFRESVTLLKPVEMSLSEFKLLPQEQRLEILKYLAENCERVSLEPSELLLYSVLFNEKEMTAVLKDLGASFTEQAVALLTDGKDISGWNDCGNLLFNHGISDFLAVLQNLSREVGGKKIRFTSTMIHGCNRLFGEGFINLSPDEFRILVECFNLESVGKTWLITEAIRVNNAGALLIYAEQGWLKQPGFRDEMTECATAIKSAECLAFLLDYKKRNFDLEAEREKEDKRAEREFNSNPYSMTAMKKIWNWKKLEDGSLAVMGYKGTNLEVEVPSKIGKYTVRVIGYRVFSPLARVTEEQARIRRKIISVKIPDSVEFIGVGAFEGCCMLAKIDIPGSVKLIDNRAFSSCINLKAVNFLARGLETIGHGAFYGCSMLKMLEIPDGAIAIGSKAFSSCSSLRNVIIPDSVNEIYADYGGTIFCSSPNATAIVERNSYAEGYCYDNDIPFRYGL